MRALLLVIAAFAAGLALGGDWRVRQTPFGQAMASVMLGMSGAKRLPHCVDIYQGAPLSPVYSVGELQPADIPIPGLAHVSVAGQRQHGLKDLEVWMETMAPGAGTPIHRHDCEEVWLILGGTGTAFIQGKDGRVAEAPLAPNSTFTVIPNARHQVVNTGSEDLHAVIAVNNPPFRPFLYKSWEEPYDAGQPVFPMLWDRDCPTRVPASLAHLVLGGGAGAGGSTSEL